MDVLRPTSIAADRARTTRPGAVPAWSFTRTTPQIERASEVRDGQVIRARRRLSLLVPRRKNSRNRSRRVPPSPPLLVAARRHIPARSSALFISSQVRAGAIPTHAMPSSVIGSQSPSVAGCAGNAGMAFHQC